MNTIKDAVIELGGKIPKVGDKGVYQSLGSGIYYVVGALVARICDHEAFEAEAKRMGYINGYLWGKEYPTNGKRPDLPDGTQIEILICGPYKLFNPDERKIGDFDFEDGWNYLFRITDPRYKPVDEVSETDLPESVYSMKKEPDNSWFEKGEFPPSGAECEVLNKSFGLNSAWENCKILFMGEFYCVYSSDSCKERVGNLEMAGMIEFRPIKSECQKFIESAIDASVIDNGIPVAVVPYLNEVFERMFHAGFKSPEKVK